jgi:hypothetical protein
MVEESEQANSVPATCSNEGFPEPKPGFSAIARTGLSGDDFETARAHDARHASRHVDKPSRLGCIGRNRKVDVTLHLALVAPGGKGALAKEDTSSRRQQPDLLSRLHPGRRLAAAVKNVKANARLYRLAAADRPRKLGDFDLVATAARKQETRS